MQRSCQIPTPIEYVKFMLDKAGYCSELNGKRILENSCGEGNILYEIVRRYINDGKKNNRSLAEIRKGLETDITGYEIDESSISACIDKLNSLAAKQGITNIVWDIRCKDYLKADDEQYDYIIGNPPYITYHNLSADERKYLKDHYSSCKKGRFDYYYAFLEKSIGNLKMQGTLVYLIPFSVFRNKFAETLRSLMITDIVSINDYSGTQVFDGITTTVAIIKIVNGSAANTLRYGDNKVNTIINKTLLKEKWFFQSDRQGKRFGDYYSIQNSVATLCNEAFLITNYSEDDEYVYVKNHKIEKSLLRIAVSTKSCKKKNGLMNYIIFPYKTIQQGYEHYSEVEFTDLFPAATEYLHSFDKRLSKRKVNDGVKWFEYGRTQALKEVYGDKLIIPMVITTKVCAYLASPNSIPYAGYFIKAKKGTKYTLSFAKQLLESKAFYEYVKEKGTPTTKTSYRISVKEIENFTF